jgi:SNF2 family DNA or RNA helicase
VSVPAPSHGARHARHVGSIRYLPGNSCWGLTLEPHVKLRLKRLFAKVAKWQHDQIWISDTLENARDLAWFLERYPLRGEPGDLARLHERAAAHAELGETIARIVSDGYQAPAFPLAIPARDYQRVAADLVLRAGGALIADDVGIGKTVMAICTFTDARTLPALVVTLTSLPRQWEAEIARFAPHLRVHLLRGGKPYDLTAAMRGRQRRADGTASLFSGSAWPDVIITNYHKLSGWADTLAGQVRSVVFDEAQELRIAGSAKYKAAKHIAGAAAFKMGLTATPFYNYGGEMFSVLNVLRPDALGSHDEFIREWCTSAGQNRWSVKHPKAFGTYLRDEGLMLRRTRADVGRELPPLTKVLHHVDADPAALEKIKGSASELARLILRGAGLERGAKWRAAEELSYLLRQATGIGKAPFVAEFVRLLVESGEKVLLYGWHRAVYDLWMARLADLRPVLYTGSESPAQKERSKAAFLDPGPEGAKVLVMSLRAGAGLDGLQRACRTVVFGELDWSPGVHEQCCGRPHRDGQPDPVTAYFLAAESGSDPVIVDVLGLKKAQIDGVRDPGAELIERLDTGGGHIEQLAAAYLRQQGGGRS